MQRNISDLGRELLTARLDERDSREIDPLEALQIRREIVESLDRSLADILDATQADRWDRVQRITSSLLNGTVGATELGLSGGASPRTVVDFWQERFDFTDDQIQAAGIESLASIYLQDAEVILQNFVPSPGGDRHDFANQMLLDKEWISLQIRIESQIKPFLSPTQLSMLLESGPTLLRFFDGEGTRHVGVMAGLF